MEIRKTFILCGISILTGVLWGCQRDDSPLPYDPSKETHLVENNPTVADDHAGIYDGVVCIATSDSITDTLSACHVTFGDHNDMYVYTYIPVNALAKLVSSEDDIKSFTSSKESFPLKLRYFMEKWKGWEDNILYTYEIEDWDGSKEIRIPPHVYNVTFQIRPKKSYDPRFSEYEYISNAMPTKGFSLKYISITRDGKEIPMLDNKELVVLSDWL